MARGDLQHLDSGNFSLGRKKYAHHLVKMWNDRIARKIFGFEALTLWSHSFYVASMVLTHKTQNFTPQMQTVLIEGVKERKSPLGYRGRSPLRGPGGKAPAGGFGGQSPPLWKIIKN